MSFMPAANKGGANMFNNIPAGNQVAFAPNLKQPGYAAAPAGYVSAGQWPAGFVPAPAGYVSAPAGYVMPAPPGYVPAPSGYVPSGSPYSASSQFYPGVSGYGAYKGYRSPSMPF